MRKLTAIILGLWVLAATPMGNPASQSSVVSPQISIDGQPDYSDLGRFVEFFKKRGLDGQQLAIALWQHLSGTETGLYHFHTIFEGRERDYALGNSRDPLKNLNVHNHGFCGIHGPVLAAVFREAGFEARNFSIPAWKHTATEVFYEGEWHYFDLDLRGALMRPDGVVASAAEAASSKELWLSPVSVIEPSFPNIRSMSHGFQKFSEGPLDKQYHWGVRGWTADYLLRPGESITRWWQNQGGRWHHSTDYVGRKRELVEQPPRGIKPHIANMSIWGVGSSLIQYEPDLTSASEDFSAGLYQADNLRTSPDGLKLEEKGTGSVVFEVLSPYIIVPIMDDLDNLDNRTLNRDAATIKVDSTEEIAVEISIDGGHSWKDLGRLENRVRFDLTPFVRGGFRYLVRLSMQGTPDRTLLRSLELRTWGQVAPISIPRLSKGVNVLRVGVNDSKQRSTRLLPVLPFLGDPSEVERYGIEIDGVYEPENFKRRIVGKAVLPVRAPPGGLIDWLTVGAMFTARRTTEAHLTANKIEVGTSASGPFRTVYDATGEVPDWNEHWHYAMDVEVDLEKPVAEVFLRYTGDPGLNAMRVYAHWSDPRPVNAGSLLVTHEYSIAEEVILRRFELSASGGSYRISCPDSPTNLSLSIAVPHSIAQRDRR